MSQPNFKKDVRQAIDYLHALQMLYPNKGIGEVVEALIDILVKDDSPEDED